MPPRTCKNNEHELRY